MRDTGGRGAGGGGSGGGASNFGPAGNLFAFHRGSEQVSSLSSSLLRFFSFLSLSSCRFFFFFSLSDFPLFFFWGLRRDGDDEDFTAGDPTVFGRVLSTAIAAASLASSLLLTLSCSGCCSRPRLGSLLSDAASLLPPANDCAGSLRPLAGSSLNSLDDSEGGEIERGGRGLCGIALPNAGACTVSAPTASASCSPAGDPTGSSLITTAGDPTGSVFFFLLRLLLRWEPAAAAAAGAGSAASMAAAARAPAGGGMTPKICK